MSDRRPMTPIKRPSFRRYHPSPRADALDALAAVASSTPPSPIITQMARTLTPTVACRRRRRPPACPPALLPVAWLSRLIDFRPEAARRPAQRLPHAPDSCRDNNSPHNSAMLATPPGDAATAAITDVDGHETTTTALRDVIRCDATITDVIASANTLCNLIAHHVTKTITTLVPATTTTTTATESNNTTTATISSTTTTLQARSALAIYFTSLEGVLTREAVRLRGDVTTLTGRLVRNCEFHACLMVLAWECVVAAYGAYDMSVLWAAMRLLDVSPFAVTKVLESFVKSLNDLPRQLTAHLRACEERLVECHVWRCGSELISLMEARENSCDDVNDDGEEDSAVMANKSDEMKLNGRAAARTATTDSTNGSMSREFVLEMIYKKLLAVASIRTRELLLLLNVDHLAGDVWSCLKRCLWERWRLLVGRHVDQLMLCCIYGVAKVRQCDIKFHSIIKLYWKMKHVVSRHRATATVPEDSATAHGLGWDVVRKVLLDDMSAMSGVAVTERGKSRGEGLNENHDDIIKFYNKVFIKRMRDILLQYGNNSNINASHTTLIDRQDGPGAMIVPTTTGAGGSDTTMTNGGPSPSPATRRRTMQTGDKLRETILKSPMRNLQSPRQVGRVTILAMSQTNRQITGMAASPSKGGNGGFVTMTPGTRTLYAFGESPIPGSVQEGAGVQILREIREVRGIEGRYNEEGGKGDADADGDKDDVEEMKIGNGNLHRDGSGHGGDVDNEGSSSSLAPRQLNFDDGEGEERAETIRRRFAEQRARAVVNVANGRRHRN